MEQKQKLEPKSIYDYTKILEEIPDYDEVRGIFVACQIPEWEIVKEEVTNEVIATDLYQFQTTSDKKAMLQFALAGAKRNHEIYKKALEICKRSGLDCCRMVEYIGNYPTSYPTPEESEKNKEIENLQKKDLIDIISLSEVLYKAKEEITEILDYMNILLLKKAKTNEKYVNCIKIVEDTKKRLKQNANYDMAIDNLLFNMWEEII